MIKKFFEFSKFKSGDLYKFGCVMIYPKVDDWSELISSIDVEDIYNEDGVKGIEKVSHITLLYGLHQEVSLDDVTQVLSKYKGKKISINIDGIGSFENENFSVIKLSVDSPILHEINADLRTLPYTSDFDDYSPHMTIAFVKNGTTDKYVDPNYKKEISVNLDFVFSSIDGRFKI